MSHIKGLRCRTRKRWKNSNARRSANLNVVVMTFAARHRRKSDKCLGRVPRKQNQMQNRWESVFRTTGKSNFMALLVKHWQTSLSHTAKGWLLTFDKLYRATFSINDAAHKFQICAAVKKGAARLFFLKDGGPGTKASRPGRCQQPGR